MRCPSDTTMPDKPTHPFYGTAAWKAARLACLKRARFRCAWCGDPVHGRGKARVDHIVPMRERPDLALVGSNLRALCTGCDARRHAEKGGALPYDERGCDAQGLPLSPSHHWNRGPPR